MRLLHVRPVIRLDAAYWGLKLIAWIHTTLGAQAVIPWNPKRQKRRDGLPPTWTAEELGKRTGIERFFGGCWSSSACSARRSSAGPRSKRAWRSPTPPCGSLPWPPGKPDALT